MSRVLVEQEVFRWAVDRCGLTLDDLQPKFPKIHQWATGEALPTLRDLEKLAKATFAPLGFFFFAEPPKERLPVPYFRTIGDEGPITPSPNLLESVQIMQRRQAWMREFLIEQGQERLRFVRSVQIEEQPALVAERIRRTLAIDDGWAAAQRTWTDALRVLRETMETAGILVVVNTIVQNNTHRKLNVDEFRGFVLVDEFAPVVFVNGADGKAAQMFTLAHELAHVFFGSSAAFDLRQMQPADDPMERACNRVAAEFLVPEQKLRGIWQSVKRDSEPFQTIAREFKVSVLVAARRALDLSLIDKAAFLKFYREYQHDERRTPPDRHKKPVFYPTQNLRIGRRFGSAVVRAAKEGKLLYSEAYRLTGLYGKTFDRYAASLGIGGIR
ncbi:MAG: ImmA/IrrE family metallo-endopeptidase [Planctomycetota bacterium]